MIIPQVKTNFSTIIHTNHKHHNQHVIMLQLSIILINYIVFINDKLILNKIKLEESHG